MNGIEETTKDGEIDDEIYRCIQRMTGSIHKSDRELTMLLKQG